MIIRRWINRIRNKYGSIPRLNTSIDSCPECGGKLKDLGVKMMCPPIEMWECISCGIMFEVQDREKHPGISIDPSKPITIGHGKSIGNVAAIAKILVKEQ